MKSSNIKQGITKHYGSHCCLNPTPSFPNSFEHQNSSTFQYNFATATTSSLYPHTVFTDPESLPSLNDSFIHFSTSFPSFLTTVELDEIRESHYSNPSESSHVCLDYSGHALFSFSQSHSNEFTASTSASTSRVVTQFEVCHKNKGILTSESEFESKIKTRIMKYLNVCEDDYSMFITANQTSAFRVLAECYPFQSSKNLITVYDHDNEAVDAMIEGSKNRGARVMNAEFKWPKLKIHSGKLEEMIVGRNKSKECNKRKGKGLFVFPLQSRVSGARYSYQWMNMAQQNGWHVLLDANGLGPKDMDTLGLSIFRPDFLICTFFKVFGDDPSGFSCLFVRKSPDPILTQSDILSKVGIIVSLVNASNSKFSQSSRYQLSNNVPNKYSDSDHVELDEFEVECRGLDHADSLGLVLIGTRTRCLVNWLVNALQTLSHPHSQKGEKLVTIYGPKVRLDRGPSLAFNIFDWKGERIDPFLVQKLADRRNISLGCGFIKHIWFSERYECDKVKVLEKKCREKEGTRKGKKLERNSECGICVVMASINYLNNFEDVYKLWKFVASFLDADFVLKERWRYTGLNQRTIEV